MLDDTRRCCKGPKSTGGAQGSWGRLKSDDFQGPSKCACPRSPSRARVDQRYPRPRAADALVAVGDELAVGKNRTGEPCRLRLVESRTDLGGYTRYSLFCEGWTLPSGEIRRFGVNQGYTVEKLLTDSKIGRASCRERAR